MSIFPAGILSGEYEIMYSTGGGYQCLTHATESQLVMSGGYWIYSDENLGYVELDGTGYGESSMDIPLADGWNMFSQPYSSPVAWSSDNFSLLCGGSPAETPVPLPHWGFNPIPEDRTRRRLDLASLERLLDQGFRQLHAHGFGISLFIPPARHRSDFVHPEAAPGPACKIPSEKLE